MVVTQFVLQKMTPNTTADPAQQKMMLFMPLVFGFLFFKASAGLVLYWLTGNVVGIAQQWFINRDGPRSSRATAVAQAPADRRARRPSGNSVEHKVQSRQHWPENRSIFGRHDSQKHGFSVTFDVGEAGNLHPDFENPDIVVRFHGPDVELLLANKAELLLAMEQLTMEMLRMTPRSTRCCSSMRTTIARCESKSFALSAITRSRQGEEVQSAVSSSAR